MTVYNEIKKAEKPIETLMRLGFLKQTLYRNIQIYETYLNYIQKDTPKTDAIVFTADDCHCSDRHVWTVVRRFSETV